MILSCQPCKCKVILDTSARGKSPQLDQKETDMQRFTTIQDVINEITPAFGDYAADYDIDAIAREISDYRTDTDEQGNELLTTAGFEIIAADDEFWAIAEKHEITK